MSSTSDSSSLGTTDIIGIVIGGVLAIGTVIGLVFSFYVMCCRKKNPPQVWPQQNQYNPYYPPNGGAYGQPMNTGYRSQYPPYQQQQQQQQPMWNKPSNSTDQPPSYSSADQRNTPSQKY